MAFTSSSSVIAEFAFLTADQTHVPDPGRLQPLKEDDFSYTPPFSFRWSYYKENSDSPEFAARMRVNTVVKDEKLGGSTRQTLIGHSYGRWITTEKYGKTHPEYFSLVDVERKCTLDTPGTEPCVTNPEVIDIITQGVLAELEANPGMENVAVSQNDVTPIVGAPVRGNQPARRRPHGGQPGAG
jgi:hypothetical protein